MVHRAARLASDRALGIQTAALALVVYLATAGGSLGTTDAVATYDVTRQIVTAGTVALSSDVVGNDAYVGADGRHYSPFGLLQSLWNIPFYMAGRAAAHVLPVRSINPEMLSKAAVALGNAWAAALCVWFTWLLARREGGTPRVAVGAALITAFSTALWPYSKFGFNAPLAGAVLVLTILCALKAAGDRRASLLVATGASCGLALLTRHELILAALPACGLVAWARPREVVRSALWLTAGLLPGAAVWSWYNVVRFGSVLDTGYMRDQTLGIGGSVAEGLWGLLLSPGGSLFLYAPVALAAIPALVWLWRARPRLAGAIIATGVVFVLFYAQLASWAGGRSYGPRYLVPLLPLLSVAVALWMGRLRGMGRRAVVALCVLSAAVQLPGVLVDFAKVRVAFARQAGSGTYESRMHEWPSCPLVLNAEAAAAAVPVVARHLAGLDPRPALAAQAGDRDFSQQFAFSLDFWWVHLFYLRVISARSALIIGLGLAAVAATLLRRVIAGAGPATGESAS